MSSARLLCAFFAVGCGGDDGDADGGGDPVPTVTFTGTAVAFGGETPIEGVKACLMEPAGFDCVTTDTQGMATVSGLPVGERIAMAIEAEGYVDAIVLDQVREEDWSGTLSMVPDSLMTDLANGVDVTYDPAKAHLATNVWTDVPGENNNTPVEGATFSVSPSSGEGPFYAASGVLPLLDKSLTATTDNPTAGWLNMDAGDVTVTLSAEGRTCKPGRSAWVGADPMTVTVPLRAGFATATPTFLCDPL